MPQERHEHDDSPNTVPSGSVRGSPCCWSGRLPGYSIARSGRVGRWRLSWGVRRRMRNRPAFQLRRRNEKPSCVGAIVHSHGCRAAQPRVGAFDGYRGRDRDRRSGGCRRARTSRLRRLGCDRWLLLRNLWHRQVTQSKREPARYGSPRSSLADAVRLNRSRGPRAQTVNRRDRG